MTRAEKLDSAIAYAADVLTRKRINLSSTDIALTISQHKASTVLGNEIVSDTSDYFNGSIVDYEKRMKHYATSDVQDRELKYIKDNAHILPF